MKIQPFGAELFHAEGKADKPTDVTNINGILQKL